MEKKVYDKLDIVELELKKEGINYKGISNGFAQFYIERDLDNILEISSIWVEISDTDDIISYVVDFFSY